MKIAILSFYSGVHERGVETWASELTKRSKDTFTVSGNYLLQLNAWKNADIVIPTNGRFQVLFVRLMTWILGKSMIVFGHSGPGADDKWNLVCMPDVFISFSNYQKKWADRFKFKFTKSIVISHAVDTSLFVPNKIKHKTPTVLCVAANFKNKRVNLVRDAVDTLKGYKLKVVGSGQEEQVAYERMPTVYNSSDVLCFVPETWEAFGLVYLEAMSCNLPIVTIDDPVRREIVGDAGIYVKNPEDINSLSTAIKKAFEINWRDKPRRQAEKFSWNIILREYEKLFERVLKNKKT